MGMAGPRFRSSAKVAADAVPDSSFHERPIGLRLRGYDAGCPPTTACGSMVVAGLARTIHKQPGRATRYSVTTPALSNAGTEAQAASRHAAGVKGFRPDGKLVFL